MYLKDVKFKDAENRITIGKVIKCLNLKRILNKLPDSCLLNVNTVTENINVFDDIQYNQLGYIDIAEDKFEKFECNSKDGSFYIKNNK